MTEGVVITFSVVAGANCVLPSFFLYGNEEKWLNLFQLFLLWIEWIFRSTMKIFFYIICKIESSYKTYVIIIIHWLQILYYLTYIQFKRKYNNKLSFQCTGGHKMINFYLECCKIILISVLYTVLLQLNRFLGSRFLDRSYNTVYARSQTLHAWRICCRSLILKESQKYTIIVPNA